MCLSVGGSMDFLAPSLPLCWNPQLALCREGWAGQGALCSGCLWLPADRQTDTHTPPDPLSRPQRSPCGKALGPPFREALSRPFLFVTGRIVGSGVLLRLVCVGSEPPFLHLGDGVMGGWGADAWSHITRSASVACLAWPSWTPEGGDPWSRGTLQSESEAGLWRGPGWGFGEGLGALVIAPPSAPATVAPAQVPQTRVSAAERG